MSGQQGGDTGIFIPDVEHNLSLTEEELVDILESQRSTGTGIYRGSILIFSILATVTVYAFLTPNSLSINLSDPDVQTVTLTFSFAILATYLVMLLVYFSGYSAYKGLEIVSSTDYSGVSDRSNILKKIKQNEHRLDSIASEGKLVIKAVSIPLIASIILTMLNNGEVMGHRILADNWYVVLTLMVSVLGTPVVISVRAVFLYYQKR
jgi:membrane-anchored glycerophosphoryl diester phosphodiesterase (GDPDase)